MENVRKHRDIKLERRRNYLVSEPNYHITKFFTENLLAIEMKKTKILMSKPAYLGLSILELSKILMYEFWYDFVKPKYGKKVRLSYMDTDIWFHYIHKNRWYLQRYWGIFDTSNYELECNSIDRSLPKGKNKKLIGLIKDELGGKILIKFVKLRAKTYSYLMDDDSEDKKAKGTKKFVIKRKGKFENYKNCLKATQLENEISY